MWTHYERSIDVEVPVEQAYAAWDRLGDFASFVEELEEVERFGPGRSRWRARLAGVACEWTAEVTERIPGRRIAWRSRSGSPNAGCVTFHRLAPGRTRVMLQVDFEPEGLLAAAGDVLRVPQGCLDAALERFREHVESSPPVPARRALREPPGTHVV